MFFLPNVLFDMQYQHLDHVIIFFLFQFHILSILFVGEPFQVRWFWYSYAIPFVFHQRQTIISGRSSSLGSRVSIHLELVLIIDKRKRLYEYDSLVISE